jgi:hypothetical protein
MPQFFSGQLLCLRSDLSPVMRQAIGSLISPKSTYYATRVHGTDALPLVQVAEYGTERPVLDPHDLCPADLSADLFEPVLSAA